MTGRALTGAVVVLLLGLAGVACDRGERPPVARLVIAGGGEGSVYDAVGRAFAGAASRRWGIEVDVRRTGASEENLRLVAEGTAHVGFARVDVGALAVHGDLPFSGVQPVAALAGLYDDYVQIVVPAASGIRRVADLAGHTVSVGEAGTGTETVAARLLEVAKVAPGAVRWRHLSTVDSAGALRAGRIDAFFVTGGVPTTAVSDLAARLAIRVLSIPDEVSDLEARYGEYYLGRSIPARTYGLDTQVATVAIPNVLVVRRDMPDETAYRLTELLFAAKAELVSAHPEARRLDARAALATFPIDLHPGAARYYRKAKPMMGI